MTRPVTTLAGLAALATIVVAGVAGLLGTTQAPARAASNCVVVVVDAHLLGAGIDTRCAPGDPSSGFQTLTRAGFSYETRPRDGLVCRIQGRPACADTTTQNYWSYWVRPPGTTSWRYASEGPATHDPKPCSGEAWVWQEGGRLAPPRVPAAAGCSGKGPSPRPSARPTTAKPPSGGAATPRQHTTGTSTTGRAVVPPTTTSRPSRAETSAPTTAASTATSPRTSTSAAAIASPQASASPAAAAGPDPTGGSGSAFPAGAGAALGAVVVLGVGTAAMLRARRGGAS